MHINNNRGSEQHPVASTNSGSDCARNILRHNIYWFSLSGYILPLREDWNKCILSCSFIQEKSRLMKTVESNNKPWINLNDDSFNQAVFSLFNWILYLHINLSLQTVMAPSPTVNLLCTTIKSHKKSRNQCIQPQWSHNSTQTVYKLMDEQLNGSIITLAGL